MNLVAGIDQDFHRPQKSPGAYEWWHFDGTDDSSGYSFSIQFYAGNLFSAYYQDSLKIYWKKTKSPLLDPSQNSEARDTPAMGPPNPLDYCGVSFRLFHRGNMALESLQEFSQKSLKASDKHGAVLLGPNRFNWDPRGDPPSYVLTAQAPLDRATVRARLFFAPLLTQWPALPQPENPSTHTWILAAPLCHVEGTFQWVNREGESQKEVAFVGKGYHDHHVGTVPLDRFVKAWHWGRAFAEDQTLVYSIQTPVEAEEPTEGFLLTASKDGIRMAKTEFKPSKNNRNFFWLPYPKRLESPDNSDFSVEHHQTLCDGPVSLIFEDNVQWTSAGESLKTRGLSSYLYTPRLSSRFFFPMLKGKSLIVEPSEGGIGPPPTSGDVSTTRPVE